MIRWAEFCAPRICNCQHQRKGFLVWALCWRLSHSANGRWVCLPSKRVSALVMFIQTFLSSLIGFCLFSQVMLDFVDSYSIHWRGGFQVLHSLSQLAFFTDIQKKEQNKLVVMWSKLCNFSFYVTPSLLCLLLSLSFCIGWEFEDSTSSTGL